MPSSAMTHRERAITAITGGVPDYVPTFELVFHETERDFGGRTFFGTDFEPDPSGLSYADMVRYNARLYVDVARRWEHSIVFISGGLGRHDAPGRSSALDLAKEIRDLAGDEYLIMCHNDPTFGIPGGSDAMEFCTRLFERPREMHETAKRRVEQCEDFCDKALAAGLDGFILCADYCLNAGPFLSPAQFSEFVTPYLKRAITTFRERGAYVIKHTDGNIMPIIDDLVEAGPHALHSLDPMAGVDIREVKERYGDRVALCGNVHCAYLQSGTPEQIRESALYCLTHAKPGGGFVFATSNCVFRGMPIESYDLIHSLWMEHRDYTEEERRPKAANE
ncbi:MAG TPA: uroporphyrinogen decarboxylase family protein [Sumerlaeia bacterium]|nr:uroporphyrinogen decarboxylase family protein [Sumerlaeia bacterium]